MTEEGFTITTPDGQPFEIPVEGSLGLLALGDLGLLAWRQRVARAKQEMAARSAARVNTGPSDEESEGE